MFPFTALAVKDKASKQNRLHCYKRRNFLEQRINATRGGEYSGKRQDNPAAATRSPKRRRARKWGKSNKPLFLYFSFITCLSAIAESIHNGKVSRLACSPIRKGITFTHFLCQKKVQVRWKCVGSEKVFDESMSDWGSRKRSFSVSLSNLLGEEPDLLMGNIKTSRAW